MLRAPALNLVSASAVRLGEVHGQQGHGAATPVLCYVAPARLAERAFGLPIFVPPAAGDPVLFPASVLVSAIRCPTIIFFRRWGWCPRVIPCFAPANHLRLKRIMVLLIDRHRGSGSWFGAPFSWPGQSLRLRQPGVFIPFSCIVAVPCRHQGGVQLDRDLQPRRDHVRGGLCSMMALGSSACFTIGGLRRLPCFRFRFDITRHRQYFVGDRRRFPFPFRHGGRTGAAYMGRSHFWWPKVTGACTPNRGRALRRSPHVSSGSTRRSFLSCRSFVMGGTACRGR